MRTIALCGLLALAINCFAFAANDIDPAETRCLAGSDDVLARMVKDLDYVDLNLPNVPPEEQRYIEAESASALRIGQEEQRTGDQRAPRASAMLDKLHARPLYYV